MNTTRRNLAAMLALAPLAAACTVTRGGGVTSGTLDVARLTTDGEAIVSALQAMLAAPAIIKVLGANADLANGALGTAQMALAQINSLTDGSVTVSVDTARVQSLVTSLVKDAQTVIGLVQGALAKASGSTVTTVQNYLAAAQALLPFVALAASVPLPPAAVKVSVSNRPMTEDRAVAVAHGG